MKLSRFIVPAVLATAVAGCAGEDHHKTQKEQATQDWNVARAAVMGSLAKDQYKTGNFDKARVTLNEAIKLDPKNSNLRLLSARLAIENGNLELADREVKQAQKDDPTNSEADYLAGVIFQRWQKHEAALAAYASAAGKNPNELAYLLAQSEMLVTLERADEGLRILQEKVIFFEHSAAIRDAVGQLLLQKGRTAEAVDMLRQASILNSEDTVIREHLAFAQFQNKNYRDAAENIEKIFKDPAFEKRADLAVTQGESYLQINRLSDARASFEKATTLAPANTAAWLSLGKVAMQMGDVRRAEICAKKAIAIDAANPEAHLLLGYVRLRQSKLTDAMASFQKASALDPKDSTSVCMIGFVYEKSGQQQKAMSHYAQALKLKPNDELAQKLLASIGEKE